MSALVIFLLLRAESKPRTEEPIIINPVEPSIGIHVDPTNPGRCFAVCGQGRTA
jgi:hypothetical protein